MRLTLIVVSKALTVRSSAGARIATPALLTRMSMWPYSARTALTAASTAEGSVTSQAYPDARPPCSGGLLRRRVPVQVHHGNVCALGHEGVDDRRSDARTRRR